MQSAMVSYTHLRWASRKGPKQFIFKSKEDDADVTFAAVELSRMDALTSRPRHSSMLWKGVWLREKEEYGR
jgi:hypothetical protein